VNERDSYTRVMEYVLGTLELTPFFDLTSMERYSFSPPGSAAAHIGHVGDQALVDYIKLQENDQ
jgi:hypothetical protein